MRWADYFVKSTLLRLVYGVMLAVLIVTPFGVYHSLVEPYVTGALWGYQFPVGYVGLLLGITAILCPVKLRSRRFSLLLAFSGLILLGTAVFAPKEYFINLFNNTSFSPNQIDIDFSLGNLAVLGLSLTSIFSGIISLVFSHPNKTINQTRGWFPKDPIIKMSTHVKPRWKKPQLIALTVVATVALTFIAYSGVQTVLRWSDPHLDVTASYFEKSMNATSVHVGDSVEVTLRVGWHGRVLPEFMRDVKVVDALPDNVVLVNGQNVFEYSGSGGSDQYVYTVKITGQTGVIELPKPELFLDGTEIALDGTTSTIEILS
ncbi:MAG: hypothetical protein ACQCN3_15080 [Candidatus Bathyarchaeia archaeon]